MVMGNRLKGTIMPGAMPWHHRWIGNPVLSGFLNFVFRTGAGDCHCGMRGFTKASFERMNLQMPGMDGFEAARRIQALPLDPPPHLIMVTAFGRDDLVRSARGAGVECLLTKPVTASALFDASLEALAGLPTVKAA